MNAKTLDLITTILGALGAAWAVADPILTTGKFTVGSLVLAVGIAVFGYFTNKPATKS